MGTLILTAVRCSHWRWRCPPPSRSGGPAASGPVRWLRDAALLFTLLSAVVHFATEGFAALIDLSIGLLAMAVLSYQLSLREQAEVAPNDDGAAG